MDVKSYLSLSVDLKCTCGNDFCNLSYLDYAVFESKVIVCAPPGSFVRQAFE